VVKGCEDGDFVFQCGEFGCVHRRKAGIAKSGECSGIADSKIKRLLRRGQADAAAQLSFYREGDESAALLLECGEIGGRRLVHFLFADCRLHGFFCQLDQGVFLF